jgi:lysyl-tRNA synthetase class 2
MPSTVIAAFRYFEGRRALEVTFRCRRVYTYREVPPKVAAAMKAAFSKGEYFNAHIRDRYEFTRGSALEPGEPTLAWTGG